MKLDFLVRHVTLLQDSSKSNAPKEDRFYEVVIRWDPKLLSSTEVKRFSYGEEILDFIFALFQEKRITEQDMIEFHCTAERVIARYTVSVSHFGDLMED